MPSLEAILGLLERAGDEPYIGEPVSQLEHALQTAALATRANASHGVVAAALLHDIGHLAAHADAPRMEGLGVALHERLGAELLRDAGFGDDVAALVASHVAAKRWLVLRRPEYRARLSAASIGTLVHQGGAMSEDEAAVFAREPFFKDSLRLRAWDEEAKVPGARVPGLDAYRPLLGRLVSTSRTPK